MASQRVRCDKQLGMHTNSPLRQGSVKWQMWKLSLGEVRLSKFPPQIGIEQVENLCFPA